MQHVESRKPAYRIFTFFNSFNSFFTYKSRPSYECLDSLERQALQLYSQIKSSKLWTWRCWTIGIYTSWTGCTTDEKRYPQDRDFANCQIKSNDTTDSLVPRRFLVQLKFHQLIQCHICRSLTDWARKGAWGGCGKRRLYLVHIKLLN